MNVQAYLFLNVARIDGVAIVVQEKGKWSASAIGIRLECAFNARAY
jgi:hypothetical protein